MNRPRYTAFNIIKLILHATQLAGSCEYGNELSGCIKCGELLD